MLQDGLGLVLLYRFWHHIEDVVHDGSPELEIIMRFDPLLRYRLRNTLTVSAFELTSEQVSEPTLK